MNLLFGFPKDYQEQWSKGLQNWQDGQLSILEVSKLYMQYKFAVMINRV